MCTMVVVCNGCEKLIMDRYLMNVADKSWHPGCVVCADCGTSLSEKCFSRDGNLYCKEDYFRRYGTKCAGCCHGISPNELVRKARDNVYHLNCFICIACKKTLSTGEELYVVNETNFLCKDDYLKTRTQPQDEAELLNSTFENKNLDAQSDVAESEKDVSLDGDLITSPQTEDSFKEGNHIHNNNNDSTARSEKDSGSDKEGSNSVEDANGNKRRGPRTTIKAKQLEVLKATFSATPKPTRHIREQLAAETGLNMRVIQVWFQNRRSKERRLKQMNSLGGRRPYYGRSPRRMRGHHVDDSPDLPRPFGFFPSEGQSEGFYPGIYPGTYQGQEFYPHPNGAVPHPAEHNGFTGHPPSGMMDMPAISHSGGGHDNSYITDIMGPTSPVQSLMSAGSLNSDPSHYPRPSSGPYNHIPAHHPSAIESW